MTSRNSGERWIAWQQERMEASDWSVALNCDLELLAMHINRNLAVHRLKVTKGMTVCSTSRSVLRSSAPRYSRNISASSFVGMTTRTCSRSSVLSSISSQLSCLMIRVKSFVEMDNDRNTIATLRARWSLRIFTPAVLVCTRSSIDVERRASTALFSFSPSNILVSASLSKVMAFPLSLSSSLKIVPSASSISKGFQYSLR
mmetsp:Transcript_36676/g.72564  ORF Transcript_36676/g.72564 Transcript_36676/m.72564 type:complete len:201 (-) Transcript_36676:775-1377(-)